MDIDIIFGVFLLLFQSYCYLNDALNFMFALCPEETNNHIGSVSIL